MPLTMYIDWFRFVLYTRFSAVQPLCCKVLCISIGTS